MMFTAQAKGIRAAMKKVDSDIKAFAKSTVGADKSMAGTNKSIRTFERQIKRADGTTVKMTGRINRLARGMKNAEGQTLKLGNRMTDVSDSTGRVASGVSNLTRITSRNIPRVVRATDTLKKSIDGTAKSIPAVKKGLDETTRTSGVASREFQRFSTNTTRGIQSISGAALSLNNRLADVGVGTGEMSRQFGNAQRRMTQSMQSFSSNAQSGLRSVSGASLALENRLTNVGIGTGLLSRQFSGMQQQVTQGMGQAVKSTDQATSAVGRFRRGLSNVLGGARKQLTDFNNGLVSVSTNAARTGSTVANVVRNSIITPFREATNVVKGYAAVLGLLSAGSMAGTGMKRLSAIENANVSLEVMMGNAEDASAFLDDVLDFARTTPFAFPDLAETARNLVAFGMDENKVIPTMQAIGDAAAGSGKGAEGLNQIASAFGDMQVSGTLSMDQINRLASAGVPALKILANQTNKSVDEMKKEISSGSMSSVEAIDDLVEGMQNGTDGVAGATASMGGLMERMKDTWVGSVDSMKSSISSNMANLMEPIKPGLQSFMSWFGNSFGNMTNLIMDSFRMMKPAAKPLNDTFQDIGTFLSGDFLKVLKDVGQALKPIASIVGMTLVAAFSALAIALKEVIGPLTSAMADTKLFAPLLAGLITYLVASRVAFVALTVAKKANSAAIAINTALLKANRAYWLAFSKSGKGVRGVLVGMTAGMRALNLTMLKNPYVIIAVLLASLAAIFYTAYQRSETFRAAVDRVFESIKVAASAVGDWLGTAGTAILTFFSDFGKASAEWFKDSFLVGLSNGFESVKGFFRGVGQGFANVFGEGMRDRVSSIFSGFTDSLKAGFSSVGGALSMVAPAIAGFGTRLLGLTGPVGIIIGIIVSLISTFYRLYQTNEGFREGIQSAWNGIRDTISSVMTALKPIFDAFRNAFNDVLSELMPELNKTKDTIQDSFGSLKPVFEELGNSFKSIGDVFSEVVEIVSTTVSTLIPLVIPIIKQLFSTWLEIQQTVIKAIMTIVSLVLPLFLDAVKKIFTQIFSFVLKVIPIISSIIETVGQVIKIIATIIIPTLLSVVQKLFPVILAVVEKVITTVVTVLTVLIKVVLSIIQSVLPALLSIVQKVFPIIRVAILVAAKMIEKALNVVVWVINKVLVPAIEYILKVVQIIFPIIVGVIEGALKIIIGIIDFFVALFTGNWKGLWDSIKTILSGAWTIIRSILKGALDMVLLNVKTSFNAIKAITSTVFNAVWRFIKAVWNTIASFVVNTVKSVFNTFKQGWTNIFNTTKSIFNAVRNFITSLFNNVFNFLRGLVLKIFNTVKQGWINIFNNTKSIFNSVFAFLKNIWQLVFNTIRNAVINIYNRIRTTFNNAKNIISSIFNTVFSFIKGIWKRIYDGISSRVTDIRNGIRDGFNTAKDRVSGILNDMWTNIKNKFTDMVNLAKGLPKRIGDGIGSMASKVMDGIKKVSNNMLDGLSIGVNGVIRGVNWVLDKIGVSTRLPEWKPNYASASGGGNRGRQLNNSEIPQYAKGTGGHPGGLAMVGDGGMEELIQFPNGRLAMSPDSDTLVNMPRGTAVMSGPDTKSFLGSLPHYNNGVGKFVSGAIDWTKDMGGRAVGAVKNGVGALKDKAMDVWDWMAGGAKNLMNKVLDTMGVVAPSFPGGMGEMSKGAFGYAKNKVIDYVKGLLPDFSAGGGGNGPGWPSPFRKSSSFNPARRHPITGRIQPHNGDDWAAPSGTPMPSQSAGRVTKSGWGTGYGNVIYVQSGGGLEYRYAHNSRNLVSVGDIVRPGQTIGLVGSTGDSTGPHVHYEVRRNGRPLNPSGFADGGIVDMAQLAWIAEGGWAESVISHDPAKRVRQKAIWKETGDNLGFTDNDSKVVSLLQQLNQLVGQGFEGMPDELVLNVDSRSLARSIVKPINQLQADMAMNKSIMKGGGRR